MRIKFKSYSFMKKCLKNVFAVGLTVSIALNGGYNIFAENDNIQLEATVSIQGEGTKTSPYLITEENQIVALANGELSYSAYYQLENDIKLRSYEWKPICNPNLYENFSGTFDGNGHTISNLKIGSLGSNYSYLGLFGNNTGTIKNLNLEITNINTNVDHNAFVGGIAAVNSGTIDNCRVSGNITATGGTVGGIVGNLDEGKIINSYSDVNISGEATTVGGIIGSATSSNVENCGFYGKLTDLEANVGGVVGYLESTNMKNCYNNSEININGGAGGIIGTCKIITKPVTFTIQQCYNKSNIISSNGSSGSLIEYIVSDCNSDNKCYIKNCYNVGNITTALGSSGGLIGHSYIYSGNAYITNCYVKGNIVGSENNDFSYTGGIIGEVYDGNITFENCSFIGKVTGYNAKAIIGKSRYGDSSFKNVFYDKSISGVTDDYNVGLTSAEIKDKESYLFWDFDTIWDIDENYNDGYPYLRALGINTSGIELSKTSLIMIEGNTYSLNSVVSPDNASNKNVIWKSGDNSIVTVDKNGILTAVTKGEVKISAVTVDGGYKAECNVTVKESDYAETTVTLKTGNAVGVPGKKVKIPVTIKNNSGISSFGINIVYDNKYLTPVEVTDGEIFKDNITNLNYNSNTIRVTNAGASNKTGDGVLFYVTFNIKDNITDINTQIEVKVDQLKTVQENNTADVEYFLEDGYVQIKNIILGDVDGDGEVTANDATEILMNYALLKEFDDMQTGAGDVDGDGEVTANDATQVLFKYAGFAVEW